MSDGANDRRATQVLVVQADGRGAARCRAVLEGSGFSPRVTKSAERALRALADASTTYEAVVLDLDSPGIDGLGIMTALRAHPPTSSLPILALSENDDGVIRELALGRGCDQLVVGPIDHDRIATELREMLARMNRRVCA